MDTHRRHIRLKPYKVKNEEDGDDVGHELRITRIGMSSVSEPCNR